VHGHGHGWSAVSKAQGGAARGYTIKRGVMRRAAFKWRAATSRHLQVSPADHTHDDLGLTSGMWHVPPNLHIY